MARLCGRPGCSESGVVAYGMVPEDLLFWISPLADSPVDEPGVLCARHADAMVVPRGWTLDDRREHALRLFKPRPVERPDRVQRRTLRRSRPIDERPEQLQIDGTGEITRPAAAVDEHVDADEDDADEPDRPDEHGGHTDTDRLNGGTGHGGPSAAPVAAADDGPRPWEPEFDHDDDLNGLLQVSSPLLSRAFRGTGRRR